MIGFSIDEVALFDLPQNDEVFGIDATLSAIDRRLDYILSGATLDLIPERWRNADFNHDIEGWQMAENFAKKFPNGGRGLFFSGGVGRGKTHLSGAIAKYVIENYHVPVIFRSYSEMLDKIKQNFDGDRKEIDRLCDTPLLIIDDLGQEKQTEWNHEVLFRIINSRYETNSPVVVTTNLSVIELRENVGEAVFSRLYEMTDKVKITGRDYRTGRE